MTEQDFQAKLSELIQQIAQLPAPEKNELGKLADDARERQARMTKTLTELQESLDYLRLSVKYLVFDLEATRRENQQLRKLLERRPRGAQE